MLIKRGFQTFLITRKCFPVIKLIHPFFLKDSGEQTVLTERMLFLLLSPFSLCLYHFWGAGLPLPFLILSASNSLTQWLLSVSWTPLFLPKSSAKCPNIASSSWGSDNCFILYQHLGAMIEGISLLLYNSSQLQNQMKRSFSFVFKSPQMRQGYFWSQTIWQQMHRITLSGVLINNCLEFTILYIFRMNCCKTGSWDENRFKQKPSGKG